MVDIILMLSRPPVVSNIWAIHHDDSLCPDPFVFDPERFVKPGEKLRPESLNEGHFGFGFGTSPVRCGVHRWG